MFGGPEKEGRIRTEGLIEACNAMEYTCMNLAFREFNIGVDYFEEMRKKSDFPFISANWVYRESGEPVAEPYVVKKLKGTGAMGFGGVSIGFVGLNRSNSGADFLTPDGRHIVVKDPVETAGEIVPELKNKCDVIIVLARMSYSDVTSLVKEVNGIDFVLTAWGARTSSNFRNLQGTKVAFSGHEGKHLNELRLYFEGSKLQRSYLESHNLGDDIPDDKKLKIIQDSYLRKIENLEAGVSGEEEGSDQTSASSGSSVFATSKACKDCHQQEYKTWKSNSHSKAFESLEKAKQTFNSSCLDCHTLGYKQKGGFLNPDSTPGLKNVQCENCHGAGKKHIKNPEADYAKDPTVGCELCHNETQDPNFDFKKDWNRIKH